MASGASSPSLLNRSLKLPCGQVLPNRLMKAALNESLADRDGFPSPDLQTLFRRWSQGGFGLLVTGNVVIDRRHLSEPDNVVIESDAALPAMARWAAAAKSGGSRAWIQVNHPGRQASPFASSGIPVAPSAIPVAMPRAATPHALTEAEIDELIERFARVANLSRRAGFDGAQIHGAHGYLVSQFLSPLANRREDGWGGDPERRMRFLMEVVRASRRELGPDLALAVKLNSADFDRGGFSEEESSVVIERLVDAGVDLIEVSGGTYEAPAMMAASESTRRREAFFLEYAERVRGLVDGVPLAVTGGFRSAGAMEAALESGACDVIGLGRPACLNADAARDLLEGRRHRVAAGAPRVKARRLVGRFANLKQIDGALNVQWHTDQIHRLADGREPTPDRPWWRTVLSTVRRNGARLRGNGSRGFRE